MQPVSPPKGFCGVRENQNHKKTHKENFKLMWTQVVTWKFRFKIGSLELWGVNVELENQSDIDKSRPIEQEDVTNQLPVLKKG